MAIFNSYVKLPEGIIQPLEHLFFGHFLRAEHLIQAGWCIIWSFSKENDLRIKRDEPPSGFIIHGTMCLMMFHAEQNPFYDMMWHYIIIICLSFMVSSVSLVSLGSPTRTIQDSSHGPQVALLSITACGQGLNLQVTPVGEDMVRTGE